jgi:CheY-like chemotaxis protein
MSEPRGAVLVVEDDPDILDIMCMALRGEGYETLEAASGEAALEVLAKVRPALILLDLRMPGMSGREFRAEQLKRPALATIPVVLLSADASIDKIAHALQVDEFLRKPISLADLLRIVEKYCSTISP